MSSKSGFLAESGGLKASAAGGKANPRGIVEAFIAAHTNLFGHGPERLREAVSARSFETPHNRLRTISWQQRHEGIAVQDGLFVAHIDARGRLIRLSSRFLRDASAAIQKGTPDFRLRLATPEISAERAIEIAAQNIGAMALEKDRPVPSTEPFGADRRQEFRAAALKDGARVRLVWLPLGPDSARLCWRVELCARGQAETYQLFVDTVTGDVLVRRSLTFYVGDSTFNVFVSDSPSPSSPGLSLPGPAQPPGARRQKLKLSAVSTNASPAGWIDDGINETLGNNVDAHTDHDNDDQPDLPRPRGLPRRVFDFPMDLGQAPESYANASVVQLFYWNNWMHDRLYELGFTEAAGNFQKLNYGRGGEENDPVMADAQDGGGFNNANMTVPEDGVPGRMQMYLFDGPKPQRDGSLDAEIVLHEYTHGLTIRSVGGGDALYSLQPGGLGEGWSDFYAIALLSESHDDPNGAYPAGAYASYLLGGLEENYYFGIRRYPYSTDLRKNPLTFKDIDPSQASAHPGVPRNPIYGDSLPASEVHAQGEVWCSMLWEARAALVAKHGFAAGNQLILQLVTDALRLTPPDPTFVEARDAIIEADLVNNGGANAEALWTAFAKRGMGFSAEAPPSVTTLGVIESFDIPDDLVLTPVRHFAASGPVGGPFRLAGGDFVLRNASTNRVSWTASVSGQWLELSAGSGEIEPGAPDQPLALALSPLASRLPAGIYRDTLTVSNRATGRTQTRGIALRVGQPDYLTYSFSDPAKAAPFRFASATFTPDSSPSGYRVCHEPAEVLATDTSNGTPLEVGDDSFVRMELSEGKTFRFFGRDYTSVFVCGNGYLTFGKGATDFDSSLETHFALPRISAFATDLNTFFGGAVSAVQLPDRLAVTYDSIPTYYDPTPNTFQAELFFDGTIRVTWLDTATYAGVVGLSRGEGVPAEFAPTDFPASGGCAPVLALVAPAALNESAGTLPGKVVVPASLPTNLVLRIDFLNGTAPAMTNLTLETGALEASFAFPIPRNPALEGTRLARLAATAPGFREASMGVEIHDAEQGVITLVVPERAGEGAGVLPEKGVVRLARPAPEPVVVRLASSEPARVSVPEICIVPANSLAAEFPIAALEDNRIDDQDLVSIFAAVENWSAGEDSIAIADNEPRVLTLSVPKTAGENTGLLANAGSVSASGILGEPLAVRLQSSRPDLFSLPAQIVIPAGSSNALFDLQARDDSLVTGVLPIEFRAEADGFSPALATSNWSDDETPAQPSGPNPPDASTNNSPQTDLSWAVANGEGMANGGFESGAFGPWHVEGTGGGRFALNDGTLDPDGPGLPANPYEGRFSAVSEQSAPGRISLWQEVSLPPGAIAARLRWVDRIHNHAATFHDQYQSFRVEVQSLSGEVLGILFRTREGDPLQTDWTRREADLGNYVGQQVRIVFVLDVALSFFNVHLDQVELEIRSAPVDRFRVYFGTSSRLGPGDLAATASTNFLALPPLEANRTYFWQVLAENPTATNASPVWRFFVPPPGAVERFHWSPLPPSGLAGDGLPVTLTALDSFGSTAASFNGPVLLRAVDELPEVTVGLPTEPWDYPLGGFFPVMRLQSIYLASDLGSARKLSGVALNVVKPPAELTRWTLRLKHTSRKKYDYDDALWERAGWTTVVQRNLSIDRTGWVLIPFATPFEYDGTNNLLVDFSFKNPSFGANGASFATYGDGNLRSIVGYDFSGEPLAWDAGDPSNPYAQFPQARFHAELPLPLSPAVTAPFTNGVWSGSVAILKPGETVRLIAEGPEGHGGSSSEIAIALPNDLRIVALQPLGPLIHRDVGAIEFRVSNPGPLPARDVALTSTFSGLISFESAIASQGTIATNGFQAVAEFGSLGPGDSATVRLGLFAANAGLLTNFTSVARKEPDPNPENDSLHFATNILPPPVVSANDPGVFENSPTNGAFQVALSRTVDRPVSVDYLLKPGTASTNDFEPASGTVVFPPGERYASIEIAVRDDSEDEADETVFLELSNPVRATVASFQPRATIVDDDGPRIFIDDASATEGDAGRTNMTFVVRLESNTVERVVVHWSTAPSTASEGSDYASNGGTLTFEPGTAERTIRVTINSDTQVEPDEKFFVSLDSVAGARIGRARAQGTILNDDGLPGGIFSFSIAPVAPLQFVGEPFALLVEGRDYFGHLASNYSGSPQLRAYMPHPPVQIGSNTDELWDLLDASFKDRRVEVIYYPAEVGAARDLTALGLNILSVPETPFNRFTIRMKHTALSKFPLSPRWESGWTVVYQAQQTISATGLVTFAFSKPFSYDGVRNLMVDFSFRNSDYSFSDNLVAGTEREVERAIVGQSDSFDGDPLNWSGESPFPYPLTIVPDIYLEGANPVPLNTSQAGPFTNGVWSGPITGLAPASGAVLEVRDGSRLGGFHPVSFKVRDDLRLGVNATPNPVTVDDVLTIGLAVTNEGPGISRAVRVSGELPPAATLLANTASVGAFRTDGSQIVWEIPELPGGAGAVAALQVRAPQTSGDLAGSFTATRAEPDAYPSNNTAEWRTRVLPRPSVSAVSVTASEGGGVLEVPVELSNPSSRVVSVDYAIFNGTASSADYVLENGTLEFPPGVTNRVIPIKLVNDAEDESGESLLVSVFNPVNAEISGGLVECFIEDDDGPELILAAEPVVVEGHTGARSHVVQIRLNRPSVERISFDLETIDGTAKGGSDFDRASARIVIPPGQTNIDSFAVRVRGDLSAEPDEFFHVSLSNLSGATAAQDRVEIAILNDDGLPGELDSFLIDPLASPVIAGQQQFVSILARDGYHNRAEAFSGPATLSAEEIAEAAIGEGRVQLQSPLGTYGPGKLQSIYYSNELARSFVIDALSLDLTGYYPFFDGRVSGLTIRLKHTARTNFTFNASWETNGWSNVIENATLPVAGNGWLRIPFDRPFAYNGTNHLMADFNVVPDESAFGQSFNVYGTDVPISRSLSGSSFLLDEKPPVEWSGRDPFPSAMRSIPNVRFHGGVPFSMSGSPEIAFVAGGWFGARQFSGAATEVRLRVQDSFGRSGVSEPFEVVSPLDSDGDGLPDAWERLLGLDLDDPSDASADLDRDGSSNLEEYAAGTTVSDPRDALSIYSVETRGSRIVLQIFVVPGRAYVVERADRLGGQWTELLRIPLAESDLYEVTDPIPFAPGQHFYRVRLD